MHTITLTLSDDQLALLLGVIDAARVQIAKTGPASTVSTGKHLRSGKHVGEAFKNGEAFDTLNNIGQEIRGQVIDERQADDLAKQANALKGCALRSEIRHIIEAARDNAQATIREENAAGPQEWGAIFTGSIESLICHSDRATGAARRWFARRGIRP